MINFNTINITEYKPVQKRTKPMFTSRNTYADTICFKGKMTPDEVKVNASKMYDVFKAAEEYTDRSGKNMFLQVAELMVNGDSALAQQIIKALQNVKSELSKNHDLSEVRNDSGKLEGKKVKSGSYEQVFNKRTNMFSYKDCSFKEFLEHPTVLSDSKKVIVACTGWTKPPATFFVNAANTTISGLFDKDKPETWQDDAEAIYVQMIKDYLTQVVDQLKNHKCNTNDLVFLYGVTPEGVDRAVEEFCKKAGIKCVGVTCFDWAPFIKDETNKPPIYIAQNPKMFGQIMGDASDKIVVVGGRSFAATTTESQKDVAKGKVVPVDILKERANIAIPDVVTSDDDLMSAVVLNAARLLLGKDETNPETYPEVKGKLNTDRLPNSVFYTFEIIKNALDNLETVKKAEEDLKQRRLKDKANKK